MENLELLTPEGHPNYAAYLLADENGSSLQVAKYAGTDRVDLAENRDYGRCSLVKALNSVLERVDIENTIFTKIGYPRREETPLFDPAAMREAVINAVEGQRPSCKRQYGISRLRCHNSSGGSR